MTTLGKFRNSADLGAYSELDDGGLALMCNSSSGEYLLFSKVNIPNGTKFSARCVARDAHTIHLTMPQMRALFVWASKQIHRG